MQNARAPAVPAHLHAGTTDATSRAMELERLREAAITENLFGGRRRAVPASRRAGAQRGAVLATLGLGLALVAVTRLELTAAAALGVAGIAVRAADSARLDRAAPT